MSHHESYIAPCTVVLADRFGGICEGAIHTWEGIAARPTTNFKWWPKGMSDIREAMDLAGEVRVFDPVRTAPYQFLWQYDYPTYGYHVDRFKRSARQAGMSVEDWIAAQPNGWN